MSELGTSWRYTTVKIQKAIRFDGFFAKKFFLAGVIDALSKNSARGFTPDSLRNLAEKYPEDLPTRDTPKFQVHNIGDRLGQEKVSEVLRRYGEGESARSLAQEYGVTSSALVRLLRRNNVVVRRKIVSAETKVLLVKEYEEGATVAELEDRYQLSHGSVLRALYRGGVEMRAKAPRKR